MHSLAILARIGWLHWLHISWSQVTIRVPVSTRFQRLRGARGPSFLISHRIGDRTSAATTRLLILLPAVATTTVIARECSNQELVDFKANQTDFETACAALEANNFHTDQIATLNATQLAGVAACHAPACLDAMTKMMPSVPDCDIFGSSMKRIYERTRVMCEKQATGPLSKAQLLELFKDFVHDGSSGADDGNDTVPFNVASNETRTAPVTVETSVKTTSRPPAATPVPSPTSSASGVFVASATITVATAAMMLWF